MRAPLTQHLPSGPHSPRPWPASRHLWSRHRDLCTSGPCRPTDSPADGAQEPEEDVPGASDEPDDPRGQALRGHRRIVSITLALRSFPLSSPLPLPLSSANLRSTTRPSATSTRSFTTPAGRFSLLLVSLVPRLRLSHTILSAPGPPSSDGTSPSRSRLPTAS